MAAELKKTTGQRWEVDHIVPIKSKLVCGLHCASNLRRAVPNRLNNDLSILSGISADFHAASSTVGNITA